MPLPSCTRAVLVYIEVWHWSIVCCIALIILSCFANMKFCFSQVASAIDDCLHSRTCVAMQLLLSASDSSLSALQPSTDSWVATSRQPHAAAGQVTSMIPASSQRICTSMKMACIRSSMMTHHASCWRIYVCSIAQCFGCQLLNRLMQSSAAANCEIALCPVGCWARLER